MDTDQMTNDEPTGEGAAPEPAEPQGVSREEFDGVLKRLDETTKMNERLLGVLESRQAPPPQRVEEPEPEIVITDDDEGDTRVAKLVQKALRPVQQQLRQLADVGLGTMSKISDRQVVSGLVDSDRTIYTRYKGEIDGMLSQLAPAVRAQPEAFDHVFRVVKGNHLEEIVAERVEAANRQAVKGAKPGAPAARGTATGANATPNEGIPTPEDLFGKDSPQVRAIEDRGGPDAWAKRMSQGRYKNWADYTKAQAKYRG